MRKRISLTEHTKITEFFQLKTKTKRIFSHRVTELLEVKGMRQKTKKYLSPRLNTLRCPSEFNGAGRAHKDHREIYYGERRKDQRERV